MPGSSGPPTVKSQIVEVPGKLGVYAIADPPNNTTAGIRITILAVDDPYTKKTCILDGPVNLNNGSRPIFYQFYVSDGPGLRGYGIGPSIDWRGSYLELPTAPGSMDRAIARFEAEFDGAKLLQIDKSVAFTNTVLFRSAAPFYYFSDAPSPGGAMVIPTTESLDLTDGVLRMDVRNPSTKIPATFWVDLKAKKVIKSVVNGQEMDLTTGKPFAVPLKKN